MSQVVPARNLTARTDQCTDETKWTDLQKGKGYCNIPMLFSGVKQSHLNLSSLVAVRA